MLIKPKEDKESKTEGIIYLVLALFLFFGLVLIDSEEIRGISAIGKIIAIILFIVGITKINTYNRTKEEESVNFEIKDSKLFYEDKEYSLNNAYLTIAYEKIDRFYEASLHLEGANNSIQIFEDIILDNEELNEILNLIKPYRKTEIPLIEKKEEEMDKTIKEINEDKKNIKLDRGEHISLFNRGLIIDGQEILYSEIESFISKEEQVRSKFYLDIFITLKNGTVITKRLEYIDEQAKAYYAEIFFNNGGKFEDKKYKCFNNIFWLISFIIAILAIFGFRGDFGFIGVIVVFFIVFLYFMFGVGYFYHYMLCKGINKLIAERVEYDRI